MSDKLSWDEANKRIEDKLEERETHRWEIGDDYIEFTIRPLTREEQKKIKQRLASNSESKFIPQNQSTRAKHFGVPDDNDEPITLLAEKLTLKYGIVDAPEGFDVEEDIDDLPQKITQTLYDRIGELSGIVGEEIKNFR